MIICRLLRQILRGALITLVTALFTLPQLASLTVLAIAYFILFPFDILFRIVKHLLYAYHSLE